MTSKQKTIETIARQHLRIETLTERKSDSLDFHEVAVWSVEKALSAAFDAGQSDLLTAAVALLNAKDSQMETAAEWRRFRRAIKAARKHA